MSNFFTAAKSDSCILAVHPWFGGSWWSKLNKGTPRDFSQGSKIWDSFYAVQNSLDLSHDYSFVCEFENTVERGSVFYNSALRTVFGIFQFNSSSIIITSNLLQNTTTGRKYVEVALNQNGQPLTGRHSAKMTVIGNTATVYLDGNVIATVEGDHIIRNVADEFEAPSSSCGYLYHITLADLTTDSVVWQPEHYDLYAQYVPRVFSTSAHWPGFVSAFNSNGIKGYHFSIKFSLSEMPSRDRVLFGNQMALGEGRFMLALSSKGKIQVQDESSWSGMVEHPISGTGEHTVMIKIAESSGRIIIDGVEYAVSVSRTAPILTIAFSNFPGTISSILLESDSGTLWQAAYSDLYDTLPAPPWPSSIPRNFAEEPATWHDAAVQAATIEEDDCEFFIEYTLMGAEPDKVISLYYHNVQSGSVNLAFNSGDNQNSYSAIRLVKEGYIIPKVNVSQLGRHAIKAQRIGLTVSVYMDGVLLKQYTGTEKVAIFSTVTPGSTAPCNIHRCYWKNLTTGKIVWSYPSEAERVRLITKTNIRTDRGAFEAADSTVKAGISTQLDLRGNSTSKTFWARGYFPKHESDGLLYVHPMIEQGDTTYAADSWVFRVAVWEDYRPSGAGANYLRCDFVDADNVVRMRHIKVDDDFFNATHDIAYVLDFQGDTVVCPIYIDGLMVAQTTYTAKAFGTGAAGTLSANVGIRRDSYIHTVSGNSVEYALVFDRALSEGEIKLLSTDNAV